MSAVWKLSFSLKKRKKKKLFLLQVINNKTECFFVGLFLSVILPHVNYAQKGIFSVDIFVSTFSLHLALRMHFYTAVSHFLQLTVCLESHSSKHEILLIYLKFLSLSYYFLVLLWFCSCLNNFWTALLGFLHIREQFF